MENAKRLEDACKQLQSEGYKTMILQDKIDAVAFKGKIVLIEVKHGKTVIKT